MADSEEAISLALAHLQRQDITLYYGAGENDAESSEDFDKEAFIEAVRKFRCLWDVNDKTFKDRNMKANAWKQLAGIFKRDGRYLPFVIIRFSHLT